MCILCDAALAHTGALHNPLIVGIDHFSSMALVRTKSGMQAPVPISLLLMISTLLKSKSLSQKAWKSDNS